MGDKQQAVIKTLLYSSLFKSVLSLSELHYFLESKEPLRESDVKQICSSLPELVIHQGDDYALKDYEEAFSLTAKRRKNSQRKILLVQRLMPFLTWIPSIMFLGLSGSVAVNNADMEDDIDLFVITADNTLYTTRLLILLVLQLIGRRRRRTEHHAPDKLCLNMLMTESSLSFPETLYDLYTAREIVQLHPLFERDNMYERFLAANNWTRTILPNATGKKNVIVRKKQDSYKLFEIFEPLFRKAEQAVMSRHKSTELIEKNYLALHPGGKKEEILHAYNEQLRRLKLL